MNDNLTPARMEADIAFVRTLHPKAFHYRTTRKHYIVMSAPMELFLGEGKLVAGAWANAAASLKQEGIGARMEADKAAVLAKWPDAE